MSTNAEITANLNNIFGQGGVPTPPIPQPQNIPTVASPTIPLIQAQGDAAIQAAIQNSVSSSQQAQTQANSQANSFVQTLPQYVPINVNQELGINNMNPVDYSGFKYTSPPPAQPKPTGNGINWWDVLSGTLGQVGGAVTTAVDNSINGFKQVANENAPWWKKVMDGINVPANAIDQTVGNAFKAGWQNQVNDWKQTIQDKQLNWGDFPLAGFLHGMDTSYKHGSDILGDLGVTNPWAKGIGGFGLDVALDPLTYFSGGLTIAGKASEVAGLAKMAELGNALGIGNKFKNTGEFVDAAKNALTKSNPLMNELEVDKQVGNLADEIQAARAGAYNANVNKWGFSVPFSSKLSFAAGDIKPTIIGGLKNPFYRTEATLGSDFSHLADNAISSTARNNDAIAQALANELKGHYNVSDFADLTKTQYGDMLDRLQQIAPHITEMVLPSAYKGTMDGTQLMSKTDKAQQVAENLKNFQLPTDQIPKVNTALHEMVANPWTNFAHSGSVTPAARGVQRIDNIGQYTKELLANKGDAAIDKATLYNNPSIGKTWDDTTKSIQQQMNKIFKDGRTKKGLTPEQIYQRVVTKNPDKKLPENLDELLRMHDLEKNYSPSLKQMLHGDPAVNQALQKLNALGQSSVPKMPLLEKLQLEHQQSDIQDMLHFLGNKTEITGRTLPKNTSLVRNGSENTANLEKALAEIRNSPYTKFSNTRTALGHWFDTKNPFNARTLMTGNKYVNSMANHIQDTASMKQGLAAQYEPQMAKIEQFIKKNGLSQEDFNQAIYHLEGKAPDHLGANFVANDKAQQLAGMMKDLLGKVGDREQQAGILNTVRDNYFPHVMNKDVNPEEMQQMLERRPYLTNQKAASTFNNARTGFQTIADKENALRTMEKEMSKLDVNSPEYQKLAEDHARISNMFNQNPMEALHSRISEGIRAEAAKALQGELNRYGMLVTNPKNATDLANTKGLEHLSAADAKKFGLPDKDANGKDLQHYIHPEVLKGLQQVNKVIENPNFIQKALRQYESITNIFRTGATTLKLSHYRNRNIGNIMNNLFAGVRQGDVNDAIKLLNKAKNGTLSDQEAKLMQSAYKHNVLFGGYLTDLKNNGAFNKITDPTKLEKFSHWVSGNKLTKAIYNKGEYFDNISRLANYVNGIKKFGDTGKAAQQVRTYLFNYNELTKADRNVRMVVPFWNWTKRSIPLQLKNLVESPKGIMSYERAKAENNQNQKGADYMKESGFHLPDQLSALIGGKGSTYYASEVAPTDDLKQLIHPLTDLSSLNPSIKMPIEMATNHNLFTGSALSKGNNGFQMKDFPSYLASNFGITKNFFDLFSGKKTPMESAVSYLQPVTKVNPPKSQIAQPIKPRTPKALVPKLNQALSGGN